MKTVFTSDELPHIWVHKSAPHGKSPSALSFNGDVIYSYSTAMARHISHKGKAAIVLNDSSYSVSTSKHQSWIRRAIPSDVPVFRVDGLQRHADLRFTGEELFEHYVQRAAEAQGQAAAPRLRQSTRDSFQAKAASLLEQAKAVSDFFGLRRKIDEKAIARMADAKARAEKRERTAREKRDAQERERQHAAFEAWKTGSVLANPEPISNRQTDYFNPRLFPVAFRVEGDELVSTLGARVPLKAARLAYRFALSKRGTDWRENGNSPSGEETCTVGSYRLNAINAQGIVAGCHRISWAEIERLGDVLSEETVNA